MRRPRAKAPRTHPRARRTVPAPLLQVGDNLTPRETAAYLRISIPTFYHLTKDDPTFPRGIRITAQRSVRRRVDVDRWIADQLAKQGPTDEAERRTS